MDEQCSIGEVLKDECNRKTYTRKIGYKHLSTLPKDEQEKILWRSGLSGHTFSVENVSICFHHELVFGRVFERRVSDKCCDVFRVHKMKVKGQYTISLEEAKRLKDNGYDVKPGLKVCRNCHEQVLQSNEANTDFPLDLDEDDPLESTSKDYPLDQDDNLDLDVSREELNLSLQCSGVSPLKLHGATKSRQISTAKNKLSRFQKYHTEKAAKVLGVSTDQ